MAEPFVELRCHSAYSFGDGAVSPEALVRRAAALGYPALGLTDHADLGGLVRFGLACREHGVRPVAGVELEVDGRPLALLARSATGFQNLAGLVTRSRVGNLRQWTRRTAGRGRLRLGWDDLLERSRDVELLTGPASGALATLIRQRRPEDAAALLARYREAFGARVAVEVQLHRAGRDESALAGALVELARRQRVPWVVTQDPRYVDDDSRLVHEVLTTLRHGTEIVPATDAGKLHPNGEWRLLAPEQVAARWRGAEAGVREAARIASECGFELRWVRPPLPTFNVPAGHDDDSFLRELALAGARERWGEPTVREAAQIDHELAVIGRLGFAGFFLVMWDAVRFARERGILAQGRGSAANSAVAYALGITAVDPVKHGLLFERFLSEARVDGLTEAPDIDVDFEHDRREEVLDYMYRRYQRSHSALTGVTQIYSACTAIQDAMRAFGYPAELAFKLSKRLHRAGCLEGAQILEEGLAAQQGFDLSETKAQQVLQAVRAFDDLPRLRSTHPGGFVLSSQPLGDYLPIESTTMGRTIIQFDKDDLDAVGIPKFDFLGLGGLALVRRAFDAIEARTGTRLAMYRLPDDDRATYEMISRGETIGTFQIESRAQIASILHTNPERLYDLVVQVALIRPGPIQAKFVHPYTKRRRGEEPVSYLHPALEPLLARTQGIPIFQEQAMAIAMTLAGYTAADADLLRRTMGHSRKKTRLIDALEQLRERLIQKGINESVAEQIEDDLMSFANYGFPESHAWSFALIAYATAYLKCHYPTEFLLGLLNAQPMGFYPIATLIHDSRRAGVVVLPPCLARGAADCTVELLHPNGALAGEPPDPGALRAEAGLDRFTIAPEPIPPNVGPEVPAQPARSRVAEARRQHRSDACDAARTLGRDSALADDGLADSPAHAPSASSAKRPRVRAASPPRPQPIESGPKPALRLGWRFVRGVGDKAVTALETARKDGPFVNIRHVVRAARLGRADATALARAGAFTAWEPDRRKAAWEALRHVSDTLPLAPARPTTHAPRKLGRTEAVFLDYFSTGVSLVGHPVEHLRRRLAEAGAIDSRMLASTRHGQRVMVGGLVVTRQRPESANGVLFILMEDEFGFLNFIVRREVEMAHREVVRHSPFLLIEGKIQRDGPVIQILAERMKPIRPTVALAFRSRDFR